MGRYNILPYDVVIDDDPGLPPLLKPFKKLGIEKIRPFGRLRIMFSKPGSTEWARAEHIPLAGFSSCPMLISWEYGEKKSRIFSTADQFDSPFWDQSDGIERYSLDIFSNIVWYGCRRKLPEDVLKVHLVRSYVTGFRARMGMLYSLLDFIERFGASTQKIQREIARLNSIQKDAEGLYLNQDFEAALDRESDVFQLFSRVETQAVKLKERALLWVYAIEWTAVSGVFAVVAFATWSLMVRRRLYREVGMTKSSL